MKKMVLIMAAMFLCSQAWAHSGRTDKNGCHYDRKKGEHHCHGKK